MMLKLLEDHEHDHCTKETVSFIAGIIKQKVYSRLKTCKYMVQEPNNDK